MFRAIGAAMAKRGKATSAAVAKTATSARSSGAMTRGMGFVKSHKKGIGVTAGLGATGVAVGRTRRSGLDKTRGRPTGMYNY